MNNLILTILFLFLTFFSSTGLASIDFLINEIDWANNEKPGYNFTDPNIYYIPINIRINSNELEPYYYFITFSPNKSFNQLNDIIIDGELQGSFDEISRVIPDRFASLDTHKLKYQFYKHSNSTIPLSEQVSNDFSLLRKYITLGENIVLTDTFYMAVFPKQRVPSGVYKDIAIISLYKGTSNSINNATLISRKKIPVLISVLPITQFISFNKNNEISFFDFNLPSHTNQSLQYKFESNEQASLWLESSQGTLSLTKNTITYNPHSNSKHSKLIKISNDSNTSLQSLKLIIDHDFFNNDTVSSQNIKSQIEYDHTNNVTKETIYNHESTPQSLPYFKDTFRFIIKTD